MIKARYNKETEAFMLKVDHHGIGDFDSFSMKFDTGAVATVIGAGQLFEDYSEKNVSDFRVLFEKAGIEPEDFESASGHELIGYPCAFSDVSLSGVEIPYLPFYLVVNTSRNVSLLGNDFISHCRFVHEPQGDIEIVEYDRLAVKRSFLDKNKRAFDMNELTKAYHRTDI